MQRVLAAVQAGLGSAAHQAFVQQLQALSNSLAEF